MGLETVNWVAGHQVITQYLLWLLSVIAVSHLIPGRGRSLGHPHLKDKIQPSLSTCMLLAQTTEHCFDRSGQTFATVVLVTSLSTHCRSSSIEVQEHRNKCF